MLSSSNSRISEQGEQTELLPQGRFLNIANKSNSSRRDRIIRQRHSSHGLELLSLHRLLASKKHSCLSTRSLFYRLKNSCHLATYLPVSENKPHNLLYRNICCLVCFPDKISVRHRSPPTCRFRGSRQSSTFLHRYVFCSISPQPCQVRIARSTTTFKSLALALHFFIS